MSDRKCVRAIVLKDQSVLAMKRNKSGERYYTLVGGRVEPGEDLETALRRELREETGLEVGSVKLVFIEDDRGRFGEQDIFLCEYQGGEPKLEADSEEALDNAKGQNTYEPVWLPLSELSGVVFRSASAREALLDAAHNGFPESPRVLAWKD